MIRLLELFQFRLCLFVLHFQHAIESIIGLIKPKKFKNKTLFVGC
jgi:hypothetical protein